ncbi:MAG: hypothetical protein AAGG45_06780, partial [Pseudomonadota bacterium]
MPRLDPLHFCLISSALMGVTLVSPACVKTNAELSSAPAQAPVTTAFDDMMEDLAARVMARSAAGIPVPVPVDAGGGYTHEQHKQNAKTIYEAGMLYQHTGEAQYRDLIRDILFDYAD